MSCDYCREGMWSRDLDELDFNDMDGATARVVFPPDGSVAADYGPYMRVRVGIFDVTFTSRYKIRFCPMCGRDLRGGDEW